MGGSAAPRSRLIGVDPTNGVEAGLRHIRVAIGRDCSDVPPTRGVFKRGASSTLAVSVEITPGAVLPTLEPAVMEASWVAEAPAVTADDAAQKQMQQQ